MEIPEPETYSGPKIYFEPNSIFLSFNYTRTLESLYRVPRERIFYLHGNATCDDHLILGHAWDPEDEAPAETTEQMNVGEDEDDHDFRINEANQIIASYFKVTFKDTAKVIASSKEFFSALSTITNVFVLGHSVSFVDIPYFGETKQRVGQSTSWTFSYFGTPSTVAVGAASIGLVNAAFKSIDTFRSSTTATPVR